MTSLYTIVVWIKGLEFGASSLSDEAVSLSRRLNGLVSGTHEWCWSLVGGSMSLMAGLWAKVSGVTEVPAQEAGYKPLVLIG